MKESIWETYKEHFVFRIARGHECERSFGDIRTSVTHAAAVVDDEPDTGGDIFGAEKFDVLQTIAFMDLKIGLFQSRYMPSSAVRNRHVENHEIDVDSDRELPLATTLLH